MFVLFFFANIPFFDRDAHKNERACGIADNNKKMPM